MVPNGYWSLISFAYILLGTSRKKIYTSLSYLIASCRICQIILACESIELMSQSIHFCEKAEKKVLGLSSYPFQVYHWLWDGNNGIISALSSNKLLQLNCQLYWRRNRLFLKLFTFNQWHKKGEKEKEISSAF